MSSHGRWFITGTDTDVGKTFVTAALAAGARSFGTVAAAKPIASGCTPSDPARDAARIAHCAGHAPLEWALAPEAVSPHRATLRPPFEPEALRHWLGNLAADTVLVEGVGGWRVPLHVQEAGATVTDLARWSGGRVLLVSANRIGVLNHTLLTAEAIAHDGLELCGVILNNGAPAASDDVSRASNLEDLQALLDVPVVTCETLDLTSSDATRSAGESLWRRLTCYRSSY